MTRILILGGGFGGVRCALDLMRLGDKASVTLIDRNSYHLFTPALYEIATAYQAGNDPYAMRLRKAVAIPYRDIFAGTGVTVVQADVASVNLGARHVILDDGNAIDFDYLVFALGSQTADFGVLGVNEYAYQFKTADDAVTFNRKMDELFAAASKNLIATAMKFLVIGGGFTGIELAAEMVTCGRRLAHRHRLPRSSFSVIVFEAGPKILPNISDGERKLIVERLTRLGVVVMENSTAESVTADSVKLKTGQTVSGAAVIWTAGVQPNRLALGVHGLLLTDKGKIPVNRYLQVEDLENVFAVGDIAEFIDLKTGRPVPGLGYLAKTEGSVVARNISAHFVGKRMREFVPDYRSWLMPVGGKYAMAHIRNSFTISGRLGWLVRNFADLRYFLSILPLSKALALFRKDVMMFSSND